MDQQILKQLEELQLAVAKIIANMITTVDLKRELANYPTKDYLKDALDKQAEDFGELVNELFVKADEKKANRAEVEELNKRVTRIERKFSD